VTIETDLHRAIMLALKERDEITKALQTLAPPAPDRLFATLDEVLLEALATNDLLLWACVQRPDGSLAATTGNGAGVPAGLEELRQAVCALSRSYPRPSLRRVLVEDDLGTVIVSCLGDGSALMVAAGKQAKLGPVSMVADRLARRLNEAR
jgi:hypothetical protein